MRVKATASLVLAGALLATFLMPHWLGREPTPISGVVPTVSGSSLERGCAAWGESLTECTATDVSAKPDPFARF
jgi:hypothetical protein